VERSRPGQVDQADMPEAAKAVGRCAWRQPDAGEGSAWERPDEGCPVSRWPAPGVALRQGSLSRHGRTLPSGRHLPRRDRVGWRAARHAPSFIGIVARHGFLLYRWRRRRAVESTGDPVCD